jgi:prepilin-type N-terminal cleavage/methylation domain-containing protein
MNLKLYRSQALIKSQPSEQGFSLLETMIALTTLGVCLAYAMPLFLYAKINNSKSEIRTGALIVSQRMFDNIRSKSLAPPGTPGTITATSTAAEIAAAAETTTDAASKLPLTNGRTRDPDPTDTGNSTAWRSGTNSDGTNPVVQPADITGTITPQEKLLTYAMGRQYRAKVTYCGKAADDTTEVCNTKYRKFKVEVSYNGSKVYDLEGTYTEFE